MKILYKTIHGSRLYGLDHADSDYDWYTVVEGHRKISHKIHGKEDNTIVDFATFVKHAYAGAPQALEAMFSTKAEVDEISYFRSAFVAGTNYDAYRGIMKSIALTPKWDDFKHKRHVMRLGLNMGELARTGKCWPTLRPDTIKLISWYAEHMDMDACYRFGLRLAHNLDGVVH